MNSPCVDTGDPDIPFDPDESRRDMGALPSYKIPPQVIISRPSPSEDGVPRETTVSATFDMPMDAATITGEHFAVSGQGGGRGGTVNYDLATRTATFSPDEPFEEGETVYVQLTSDISSLWGLAMKAEVSWTFRIEGATEVAGGDPDGLPGAFTLHQNYPNPFNAETQIRFSLSEDGPANLKIYSITGALVRTLMNTDLSAGEYRAAWNGADEHGRALASGVYFCRLQAGGLIEVRKMVLGR